MKPKLKDLVPPTVPDVVPPRPKIGMRLPKLNWKKAMKVIAKGGTAREAGMAAGSLAKNPETSIYKKQKDETFRAQTLRLLEQNLTVIAKEITKKYRMKRASVSGLSVSFGVLMDKYRLMKNESTENVAVAGKIVVSKMTRDEIIREAKRLLEQE